MDWISSTLFVTVHEMDLLPSPYLPHCGSHYCWDAWSANTWCAESKYEEKSCLWLSSRGMLFLETDAKVVDSLLVTLLCFSRGSSPIDHSSATILLPNSPATSPSSSSHSSCWFPPLPISFLTASDSPTFSTDCSPSATNHPSSIPLYMPSTFPANTLFLSINICLCIRTHLFCSSGGSSRRRPSSYCPFSCWLYSRL